MTRLLVAVWAFVLASSSRPARAQEQALLEVDPRQEAYERQDMAKHALTGHVGVGYPELPRVGADYLITPGYAVAATLGPFLLLPCASIEARAFLVEGLGFRPYLAAGALATMRAETGAVGVSPAVRVGFENRGVGGDWFRAEIGAAYNLGPVGLPVLPIVAIVRGFSLAP